MCVALDWMLVGHTGALWVLVYPVLDNLMKSSAAIMDHFIIH